MEFWEYTITCAILSLCIYLLRIYNKRKYSFWTEQSIPQLSTLPLLGSFRFGRKPLHYQETELYYKYGRIYGRYDGRTPVLSVAEPELLKRIFVKDFNLFPNRRDMRFNDPIMDNTLFTLEGEDWKRVRSIVSRTLTSAKLKRMLPLLESCADILVENCSKTMKDGKPVDCQNVFGAFVIDTIAKCAFAMTINSLMSEDDPFVAASKKLLENKFGFRTILTLVFPKLMKFLHIRLLNPETTDFYREIVIKIIEEREKIRGREDFCQLLLDAQNDTQDQNNNTVKAKFVDTSYTGENSTNRRVLSDKLNGKALSREEFIAQCVSFFIAGYDATTSLLCYAIYNLAMSQHCQKKVVDEIEAVMERHDGLLSYESLNEMKYMDAVISECLRLCPSQVRSERRVEEDCFLGDTSIRLKKGNLISIPVYAIHRDEEFFPEPNSFKPERFSEPDPNRPQYVYLPFGAGPRHCVGMRFVMMQVKLCLVRMLQRFHIQPTATTPTNIDLTEQRNILKVDQVDVLLRERL